MADSRGRASFRRSLGDALATADLRRLQLAWTAASVGGWVFFIVLAVYAYNEGGATAVGVAALARMLPAGLAAPLAGVVVDRRSRRDVLILITAGRGLVLAVIAAAVGAGAPLAVVLVLSALFTALQTATGPRRPRYAGARRDPAADRRLQRGLDGRGQRRLSARRAARRRAGGRHQHRDGVPRHRRALRGGGLAARAHPARPGTRLPRSRGRGGPLEALGSGFRTVVGNPSLRLLVGVLSCSTFVEGAVDVLVVLVAIELLDLGDSGVGWLNSAWALGGSWAARPRSRCLVAGGSLPAWPAAASSSACRCCGGRAARGGGGGGDAHRPGRGLSLIETAGLTLLQRLTSDDVLGRAFAVVESTYWLTTGAGAIAAPAIVGLFGVRGALVAIGLCLPVVAALRWAGLARFEAGAAIPEEAFTLLRRIPLFAPLPLGTLENVSRLLAEVEVSAGYAVVREGEPGERFYVIAEGRFEVSNSRGVFPPLGEGDVFGEIALLATSAHRHGHGAHRRPALRTRPRVVPGGGRRSPLRVPHRPLDGRGAERAGPGQLSASGRPKRGNSCGVTTR